MTALSQMNSLQTIQANDNQKNLDDPTEYGMIIGAYNQATGTYIYYYGGWHLYYCPLNPKQGYWTARNLKMELCLHFDREEPFTTMLATMDQAESDAGDLLQGEVQ